MVVRVITAPTIEPIDLNEAKAHLRVRHTNDDLWITSAIVGCRQYAEKFMGRAIITQTLEFSFDAFPVNSALAAGVVAIPFPQLQSVVSIKYDDSAGTEQTLSSSLYKVDVNSEPGRVMILSGSWPNTLANGIGSVRIRFIAGYPSAANSPDNLLANVPQSIKNAILLHIGELYSDRENVIVGTNAVVLPWGGADELLRQYRVEKSMA